MPALDIPPALKHLFDKFPFTTYAANELPASSPQRQQGFRSSNNVLHVWIGEAGARAGQPSFNPTCLKTQTYLKILRVDFTLRPSVNHASPSGALPFLSTSQASKPEQSSVSQIRNSKLPDWARAHSQLPQGQQQTSKQVSMEAIDPVHSVLDLHVRPAYLQALYVEPRTAAQVAHPLYVDSTTRSAVVRSILARQLRHAAQEELAASGHYLGDDGAELLALATTAFGQLDAFLGRRTWFSSLGQAGGGGGGGGGDGQRPRHQRTVSTASNASSTGPSSSSSSSNPTAASETPGLLDAAVFAYVHVILTLFDEEEQQQTTASFAGRLHAALARHGNLVAHARRMSEAYYA